MKKIYIQPAVETVILTHQTILATSSLEFGDSVDNASGAETHERGDWDIWGDEE